MLRSRGLCFHKELSVTPASWGALLIAWLAAIALPGPDVFLLLKLGIRNRRSAVSAALGIMAGNLLWATASVVGMSALIRAFPFILPALQVAGSCVLIWLGVQSVRGGISQLKHRDGGPDMEVTRRPFLLGFVTNIANPKALIFFTALLSQFIPAHATWITSISIIALMWITGVMWFVGVALASSSRAFRNWFGRAAPWFDIVAGAVFILVAVTILSEVVVSALTSL